MDKKLDEFIGSSIKVRQERVRKNSKKKRLRITKLDNFLPEEHINYFRALRIGSKRIRNVKISEISNEE